MKTVQEYQPDPVHGDLETVEEREDGGSLIHLLDAAAGRSRLTGEVARQGGIQIKFDFHVWKFLPKK
jgi:hypothetical protein